MIFLTVGSELPFDRLTGAVDAWAQDHPDQMVVGQIGKIEQNDSRPTAIDHCMLLDPTDYLEKVRTCQVLIAHAGMGSILTALTEGKPIVIMPRREKYRETRNDHQVGTCEKFSERPSVFAAQDETEVADQIDRALAYADSVDASREIGAFASDAMLGRLRAFIQS